MLMQMTDEFEFKYVKYLTFLDSDERGGSEFHIVEKKRK